ncbi:helix-hairpin-helix domain-containing protein [Halorussus caseinilyticus]|uniref:Helix-hairpin-helix domain-containing protein n=1 Tax=Halorussus caseinilyticus TaxID=3034025 RepID=A0ABD5WK72_9EURY
MKGIGPAYAQRLQDAGVADVTELAKADAEQLSEETGLSDKRISSWIERAQAR